MWTAIITLLCVAAFCTILVMIVVQCVDRETKTSLQSPDKYQVDVWLDEL